jgi:hypothetical protein
VTARVKTELRGYPEVLKIGLNCLRLKENPETVRFGRKKHPGGEGCRRMKDKV